MKNLGSRSVFVLLLTLFSALVALPVEKYPDFMKETNFTKWVSGLQITKGLDLAGGTELDYHILLDEAKLKNADDDLENDVNLDQIAESVRDSLEARVNPAGVGEVLVKRSKVDAEEHVLIQLPPSSSVESAKANAEQDNRLEFYEEDPTKEAGVRSEIEAIAAKAQSGTSWEQIKADYEGNELVTVEEKSAGWLSELKPDSFREKIENVGQGKVIDEILEGRAAVEYEIGENGQLQIKGGGLNPFGLPPRILALPYITDISAAEDRTQARHILLGYKGAERAAEDVPYATKEDAKVKADELLASILAGGDFAELAKEFSTGPTAPLGGDLGIVNENQMAEAFDVAIFGAKDEAGERTGTASPVGLINNVVETSFGFHIIEVLPPKKDSQITYEQLAWNVDDINWVKTELGGAQLENAVVGFDDVGQALVNLLFDSDGATLFGELTERVSSRTKQNLCETEGIDACRLGIKVGGNWITQPTVREPIYGNRSQISGSFTFDGAKALADGLNLGAIDAPVQLSGELTIEPSLGEAQLQKSLKAGAIGLLLTMIFMIFSYRWAGVIASVALMLYALFYAFILKIWEPISGTPIVISLAGAAGIALSIGLAVDGNVLIFERLREELKNGKNLKQSIDLGFRRAWSAIRDSNLTTLLSAIILYNFGSSVVKGFAVTLIVGTLLSLFTSVYVSRTLLGLSTKIPFLRNKKFY